MARPTMFILALVAASVTLGHATQASERSSQEVTLTFHPLSESDLTTAKQTAMKTSLASAADSYCDGSPSSCGLDAYTSGQITSSEVGLVKFEESGRFLKVGVYIDFPSGASVTSGGVTSFVLPKSAVTKISENARDALHDDTDAYVTSIGSEFYGKPVQKKANVIIIPVAIVVVIIAFVVAFVLVKREQKRERAERLRSRLEAKDQKTYGAASSGNSPSYNILETTTTTTTTMAAVVTPRMKAMPDSNYAKWNIEKDNMGAKNVLTTSSASPQRVSLNDFHEDSQRNNGLPPLQQEDESEAMRKEKKRLRKEKKRERRRQREENMEVHENQGMDTSNLTDSELSRTHVQTFSMERGAVA